MLNGRFQLTPMAWGAPQDRMRERSELGGELWALGPRNRWIYGSGLLDPRINGPPTTGDHHSGWSNLQGKVGIRILDL